MNGVRSSNNNLRMHSDSNIILKRICNSSTIGTAIVQNRPGEEVALEVLAVYQQPNKQQTKNRLV